jgi:iron complex outermembrane receptor protein
MHLFNGYIFLQPQSEFRLTIRGAFPVYTYEQCDARLTGGDFILKYKFGEDWNFETIWSYVHGTNRSNQLPLTFMPPLQGQHKFSYEIPEWNSWRNLKIELEHEYVAQQWHWDPTLDFIAPPKSYNLFNLQMSTTLNKWKFKPQLRVGVKNISNTIYRDYLNRQRYFANALGRNITLSWIQNF